MLINETTLNCCKPKRFTTFKGSNNTRSSNRKLRYKHYEQISEEALALQSLMRAHKDVQNSGKMRLLKAMPAITTTLLGTTIALTQPGKLAAKAGAGLGFLALSSAIGAGSEILSDKIEKHKEENNGINTPKILMSIAKVTAGIGAVVAGAVLFKNSKAGRKTLKFLKREATQLSKEINETKLAGFIENTYKPFIKKHHKSAEIISAVAPYGIIAGSALSQAKLAQGLSDDVKEKTNEYFTKGKLIQKIAKANFDNVEAKEI